MLMTQEECQGSVVAPRLLALTSQHGKAAPLCKPSYCTGNQSEESDLLYSPKNSGSRRL